ncbi:MAG TPA: DUF885 domain-containing protein [Myxococcota bacterium]|nr:DUF885 domain-containing protein [Myxococcota bacterium]
MRRRVLLFLALLAVPAAVFLVPTLWGTPWSIDHFFLRALVEAVLPHPMALSYARVLEPYGLDWYSGELEDFSVAQEDRDRRQARRTLETLARYDRSSLDEGQRLSADVLAWYLEALAQGERFAYHGYPVEQLDGLQSQLPDFLLNFHPILSERDARNYVRRLAGFGVALDQIGERVRFREARGIVPPRFVIAASRQQIAELVAPPPAEHPLVSHLRDGLAALPEVDPARREALVAAAVQQMERSVYPGYARLDALLAAQERSATDDDGVWKLPDGDAYYRYALRFHTTTDLTPDEVHETGLREVARLSGEMRALLAREGIDARDLGATLQRLDADPRFLYPDDEAGRDAILADYAAIIDDTRARLPALFGRLPKAPVVVERVPPFKEAGSAGAYYHPPSFDGSRPGTFFVNLRSVREVPKFGMRTLAYHEAIPGHHLQVALSFELPGLPFFRRVIPFTAYVEGWALYAERLALEQGFHPTSWDRLGALIAENFRAVRLVVDTGIHAKRWTREQAIDYMRAATGMPETDVVAEVERYIVSPGQACAYKIGELEILKLRARAKERLGDRFDLRAFHDVVLGQGALPLTLLDEVVERWIEATDAR